MMLKSLSKHRPKHVLAVYIEPQQVEIVRAHRHWRTWEIDSAEQFPVPEGDNLFDFLQRMNLRPRGYKGTALILFLPRTFYSFHREHYPANLGDQIEEALSYDWQENIFYEHEHTLHFFGPAVSVDGHLSIPIFALQRGIHEKFQQVLGAQAFQTFAVIPSALTYQSLLPDIASDEDSLPLEIVGRLLDESRLEIHRFYNGFLLDSMIVGKSVDNLKLFRESLRCIDNGQCQQGIHVHIVCTDGECADEYGKNWEEENLALRIHSVEGSLLARWVRYLFEHEEMRTFDLPLTLKPWKVPKVTWPILAMLLFFSLYAMYQIHSINTLKETTRDVRKQTALLETQWKPIEQLQTRISKFQEDQKTLTQFNSEGYPLLEILNVLTQITPDDTWLNYFSLRTGQLMLRGESKSAIKYLSDLSKVEGLTDVRFASPVTRNPSSDQERFNVQLQLDVDKFKKTMEAMPLEEPENIESGIENPPEVPAQDLAPAATEVEQQPAARGPSKRIQRRGK